MPHQGQRFLPQSGRSISAAEANEFRLFNILATSKFLTTSETTERGRRGLAPRPTSPLRQPSGVLTRLPAGKEGQASPEFLQRIIGVLAGRTGTVRVPLFSEEGEIPNFQDKRFADFEPFFVPAPPGEQEPFLRKPVLGAFEFPLITDLLRASREGEGDFIPGVNIPADSPFAIQSGDIVTVEQFRERVPESEDQPDISDIPLAEIILPGSAPAPGADDRTLGQEFQARVTASRGGESAIRAQSFRSRLGRGRGSTILGALGDEEATTILGG